MPDGSKHLSDEDVVRFLDDELSNKRSSWAKEHLENCSLCDARMQAARDTMGQIDDLYQSQPSVPISQVVVRGRLHRQLQAHRESISWWRRPMTVRYLPRAIALGLILVVVSITLHKGRQTRKGSVSEPQFAESGIFPNLSLTPGAIRPVTLSEICSIQNDDDDLDPALPPSIRNAVFEEYGIAPRESEQNYQIDYLINPQLGGTSDMKNLWPQSYQGGAWNAKAKDQLESRLHQMVCNRTIDLATAQREITTDWIAAYRKYVQQPAFHT